MNQAGFDTIPVEMDLSSRKSILKLIAEAKKYGEITMMINAAGVSPSQAPVETILKSRFIWYSRFVGRSWKCNCSGRSRNYNFQSVRHRMPQLSAWEDEQLACTPAESLLNYLCYSRRASEIHFMRIKWRNAATRNG